MAMKHEKKQWAPMKVRPIRVLFLAMLVTTLVGPARSVAVVKGMLNVQLTAPTWSLQNAFHAPLDQHHHLEARRQPIAFAMLGLRDRAACHAWPVHQANTNQ